MSPREKFDRRKRWFLGGIILGIGVFLVSVFVSKGVVPEAIIPAFVVVIGLSLWSQFAAFRCPECHGNLGPLYLHNSSRFGLPVNFCPFCGMDLNSDSETLEDEFTSERVEG
jgi:hypothetical protein